MIFPLKVDLEISDRFLSDVMSAASQGISGWCTTVQYDTNPTRPEMDKLTILLDQDIREDGERDTLEITYEVLDRGLRRFMMDRPSSRDEGRTLVSTFRETFVKAYGAGQPIGAARFALMYRWAFEALWDGDPMTIDSEVADMIVQYGLFGEVKFE